MARAGRGRGRRSSGKAAAQEQAFKEQQDPELDEQEGAGEARSSPWTPEDDQMLLACATMFRDENWRLIADLLGNSGYLSGLIRSHEDCRERCMLLRRRHLKVSAGKKLSEKQLAAPLMDRQTARQALDAALPVSPAVLAAHTNVLQDVAARHHQRLNEERARSREAHKERMPEHPSQE